MSKSQSELWQEKLLRNYTDKQLVECLDCGRMFRQVGSHVVQKHGYKTAKMYRLKHGLDYKSGILPDDLRAIKAQHVRCNGTIKNLAKGEIYRFKKGDGRASKIVSSYFKYKRMNKNMGVK